MTTISLVAVDQALSVALKPVLASGDQNSVKLHVDFDSAWAGLGKTAVFYTEEDKTVYECVLNGYMECTIPHEVLAKAGTLYIGVRGVSGKTVKTSNLIKYKIVKGAPAGEGTTVEPTANVYQQILTLLGDGSELKEVQDNLANVTAAHNELAGDVLSLQAEHDELAAAIESGGMKQLWANAAPSSSFAGQAVTVSGSDTCDVFMVMGRVSDGSGRYKTEWWSVPDADTAQVCCFEDIMVTGEIYHRSCTVDRANKTFTFTDGYYRDVGSSTYSTNNAVMVPLYIWGGSIANLLGLNNELTAYIDENGGLVISLSGEAR